MFHGKYLYKMNKTIVLIFNPRRDVGNEIYIASVVIRFSTISFTNLITKKNLRIEYTARTRNK